MASINSEADPLNTELLRSSCSMPSAEVREKEAAESREREQQAETLASKAVAFVKAGQAEVRRQNILGTAYQTADGLDIRTVPEL